ncbi:MAG: type VI secretion system protein TssA [Deltaproteobacteria bacterium]|nr:type VI secretion system protein TssA [Deltaproteobacteria bacterium]
MARTFEQIVESVADWLKPISDSQPTGESAKFDESYEALRAEVMKLESPRGEVVSWSAVVNSGIEILTNRSKDMLIASHLAIALYYEKGFCGLADGTALMTEMGRRFWPDLFPPLKRMRARVGAIDWYLDKTNIIFAQIDNPKETDRDGLNELKLAVENFRTMVSEQFADQAPATRPLQDTIEKLILTLPPPPKKEPPPPLAANSEQLSATSTSTSAASTSVTTPTSTAPALPAQNAPSSVNIPQAAPSAPGADSLSNRAELAKFLQTFGQSLIDTGDALRKINPSDATAYRVLRIGMWLGVFDAPALGSNGRTMIPALNADIRTKFDRLLEVGNYQALLIDVEAMLLRNRLNLDLLRYSATAMAALGEAYNGAHRVCIAELRNLLERLPSLPKLPTADGSLLADERTKMWIKDEINASASGGQIGGGSSCATLPEEAMANMKKLLSSSQTAQALAIFEPFVAGAQDGRSKAQLRLLQAELCRKAGAVNVAAAIYEALDAELSIMRIESWEPELMVNAIAGRLTCLRSQKKSEEVSKDEKTLYMRLAQLRPSLAVELGA